MTPLLHNQAVQAFIDGNYNDTILLTNYTIRQDKNYKPAHVLRATALHKAQDLVAAEAAMRELFDRWGTDGRIASLVGVFFSDTGRHEEAIPFFRAACQAELDDAACKADLAQCLSRAGHDDEAEVMFLADSGSAVMLKTYGVFLDAKNRRMEAVEAYRKAVALHPDYEDAHFNLGLDLLLLGQYEEGFEEYEWGQALAAQKGHLSFQFEEPIWKGEDLAGKRILLYCNQGYGDLIHMARYFPVLKSMGAEVHLCCSQSIGQLLATAGGIAYWSSSRTDEKLRADYRCCVMQLPRVLKQYPADVPYLTAPKVREELFATDKLYKVGVCWAGGAGAPVDSRRSIPASVFTPLAGHPKVQLYSLQKEHETRWWNNQHVNLSDGWEDLGAVNLAPHMTDFLATAGLIQNLDLVVTADTAVAHVAGALGVRTWVLVPESPDWRWGIEGDGCRWYPSVRVFRRKGNWANVVAEVMGQLAG